MKDAFTVKNLATLLSSVLKIKNERKIPFLQEILTQGDLVLHIRSTKVMIIDIKGLIKTDIIAMKKIKGVDMKKKDLGIDMRDKDMKIIMKGVDMVESSMNVMVMEIISIEEMGVMAVVHNLLQRETEGVLVRIQTVIIVVHMVMEIVDIMIGEETMRERDIVAKKEGVLSREVLKGLVHLQVPIHPDYV